MATQFPGSNRTRHIIGSRSLIITVAAALGLSLLSALPAAADPTDPGAGSSSTVQPAVQPTTADQAQQQWLAAADQSEQANEDVLAAQDAQQTAEAAAATTKVTVARTHLQAGIAQSQSVQAAAAVASYRDQLDQFASASYRGARLGQLSALLTAQSSNEYLDEVSSMDQVAAHVQQLMNEAVAAKDKAATAAATAATAEQQAADAKTAADTAAVTAEQATATVVQRKADLDAKVAGYQKLYASLSETERQQALDAQAAAWAAQAQQQAEAEAKARADAQAAAAQRAQAPAAAEPAAPASSSVAPSDSAAASSSSAQPAAAAPQDAGPRTKAQIAVAAALTKEGAPYVYGAAGPRAFDCSGLTSWAWAQAGVSIPRTSAGQAQLQYVPLDQLQPGDLVTYYSPVHHVALYIGNGQIIDASTESKPIFITTVARGGPNPTGHRVNY